MNFVGQIEMLLAVKEQELGKQQFFLEELRALWLEVEWSYRSWTFVAWEHWAEGVRRDVELGLVEELWAVHWGRT